MKPRKRRKLPYGDLRVVAVYQRKGGVGKTTTAVQLAIRAASGLFPEVKKRILLCDVDAQQNSSSMLIDMIGVDSVDYKIPPIHPAYKSNPLDYPDWNGISNSLSCYLGQIAVPYPTAFDRLDVLPADGAVIDLFEHSQDAPTDDDRYATYLNRLNNRLRDFCALPDLAEEYDLVIFDCPPGKTLITIPVLMACTDLIIPVEPEAQAVEGLEGLMALVDEINGKRDIPINVAAVIPNKVQYRFGKPIPVHQAKLEELYQPGQRWQDSLPEEVLRLHDALKLPEGPLTVPGYQLNKAKAEDNVQSVMDFIRRRIYG